MRTSIRNSVLVGLIVIAVCCSRTAPGNRIPPDVIECARARAGALIGGGQATLDQLAIVSIRQFDNMVGPNVPAAGGTIPGTGHTIGLDPDVIRMMEPEAGLSDDALCELVAHLIAHEFLHLDGGLPGQSLPGGKECEHVGAQQDVIKLACDTAKIAAALTPPDKDIVAGACAMFDFAGPTIAPGGIYRKALEECCKDGAPAVGCPPPASTPTCTACP